jgi:hypothetical protein
MAERRQNGPVRAQAEQWFEALRAHLSADAGQNDVAERLKSWATLEDLMATAPRLLPHVLTMAWQLRGQPAFAELFKTASGKPAPDRVTALAPCGKSFDDVVLAHLQGSLRVYCVRRERAWLAAERARHKPTGLATVKFLAPMLQRIKRQRDQDFLEHYPHTGLYLALKPFLRQPRQFELIEALAELPTRTVSILGNTIAGLTPRSAASPRSRAPSASSWSSWRACSPTPSSRRPTRPNPPARRGRRSNRHRRATIWA